MDKLRPCPFCGRSLVATTIHDKVHGKEVALFYTHEASECLLSYFKITPEEIDRWQSRDGDQGWVAVEDRMPTYESKVLGFTGTDTIVLYYGRNKSRIPCFMMVDKSKSYVPKITHWRYLPPEPKEKAEG